MRSSFTLPPLKIPSHEVYDEYIFYFYILIILYLFLLIFTSFKWFKLSFFIVDFSFLIYIAYPSFIIWMGNFPYFFFLYYLVFLALFLNLKEVNDIKNFKPQLKFTYSMKDHGNYQIKTNFDYNFVESNDFQIPNFVKIFRIKYEVKMNDELNNEINKIKSKILSRYEVVTFNNEDKEFIFFGNSIFAPLTKLFIVLSSWFGLSLLISFLFTEKKKIKIIL